MSETSDASDELNQELTDHDLLGQLHRVSGEPGKLTHESIALLTAWEDQWENEMNAKYPKVIPVEEDISHELRLAKIWEHNHFLNRALDSLENAYDSANRLGKQRGEFSLEQEIRGRFRELASHLKAKMIADGVPV